jgi:hypothetical protein
MSHHICIRVLLSCCVVSPFALASAQTAPGKSSPRIKKQAAASGQLVEDEANLLAEVRRVIAIALVTSLADEARNYRDESLRVRVQVQAAEVLWETDRERALSLFYRAWETAGEVDKASERRSEEQRKRFLSGQGGPNFISRPLNLRLEVLRFTARRDRELGEKFLASLEEEKKEETDATSDSSPSNYWDPTEPPAALNKRLELANLIMESGDVEGALRFADPALARATKPGIIFLYKLRQKNVAAADQRYAALLARTTVDPSADANSVSLLSSYAFTPLVFATVTPNGRAYGGEAAPAPALSADVRSAFFHMAAQVLMRPLAAPGQDRTSAGRAGTYFVIARLLPLFQQQAPDRVPELSAYLAGLTQDAPSALRDDYTMLTAGFKPEAPPGDNTQELLDQLRRAASSAERDRIYVSALRGLTKNDPPRAREIADKIENLDLRKRARAFVDFVAIRTALERKNTEEALRTIRAADLPYIQRVWAYTEVTQLLRNDPALILQLLNEADDEARRIDPKSPQRVQALTAIATRLFDVDRAQAWDTMFEVVKAADRADDFKGDNGKVTAHLQTGNMVATFDFEAPSFDLNSIFSSLAKDDLQSAIDLAKRFTAEEPRAIAIFAIARSVLDEKRKSAGRKQR